MENDLRVAAIVALTQGVQQKLGKTQIQKLVYFVQDAGVPLEYKYEIYHYGPYSFQLSRDLSSLDALGVLNIESDPQGFGFDISVGKFAEKFKLSAKYQKRVEKVVHQFGFNNAAQLEVKATIHFVQNVLKKKSSVGKVKSEVIQKVAALKPRFTKDFIKSCYSELERASWI